MKAKRALRKNQLIRLIHVAKRELRMDDDTYRLILRTVGNADSSADMGISELEAVLEHMKKAGFKIRTKKDGGPSRAMAMDAESRKVRALWLFLHELNVVQNPSEAALAAYVKRMTGVDALQWTGGEQIETVIESLKKWAMRLLPALVQQMADEVLGQAMPQETTERLNGALFDAFSRETFEPMRVAYEMLQEASQHAKVKQ